jgi:hypothetical protein
VYPSPNASPPVIWTCLAGAFPVEIKHLLKSWAYRRWLWSSRGVLATLVFVDDLKVSIEAYDPLIKIATQLLSVFVDAIVNKKPLSVNGMLDPVQVHSTGILALGMYMGEYDFDQYFGSCGVCVESTLVKTPRLSHRQSHRSTRILYL